MDFTFHSVHASISCGEVHVNASAGGDRKRASDLQVVSRPAWLLGTKLRRSPCVVCFLHHYGFAPAPGLHCSNGR